jgi:hypothetical protein
MQFRHWWKRGLLMLGSGLLVALPVGGCLQSTLQRIIVGLAI